ncbi:hypothetical protein MKW98_020368 [Papaver atlanticum]|uniref:Antimicrobial peptide 1 n=1 Tax=Papaver atlanticum TaxID=357466 RepID=A0AAD4RVN3_9MAGN|nr:hypothetical protein MKW98_020368 [Papaver atlanticum]
MAAQHKYALLVLFLVFGAFVTDFANASTFKVWRGPGCTGPSEVYGCGCHNIRYHGGFNFDYTGQPARFYSRSGCRGSILATFRRDRRRCASFPYGSIRIFC